MPGGTSAARIAADVPAVVTRPAAVAEQPRRSRRPLRLLRLLSQCGEQCLPALAELLGLAGELHPGMKRMVGGTGLLRLKALDPAFQVRRVEAEFSGGVFR